MRVIKILSILGLSLLIAVTACRRSPHKNSSTAAGPDDIKDSVVVRGLNFPWEILWGPDNYIWMTERDGRISRVDPVTGIVKPILNVPDVVSKGEGGLLGMVLHPDFANNPKVYIEYDYNRNADYRGKVVCYTYDGTNLVNPVILLDNISASSIHNGCRLLITPDLKLFITLGDASNQAFPQDKKALNGKILRINLDGSIPDDNPEPGNPYWTYGNRNPQGIVFAHNILYSSEHGPDSDDELNIIEKGRNYGWPNVRGFCNEPDEKTFCNANNVKEPIKAWTPTAAVCGLDYYDKPLIPKWDNSLLLLSLKNARLYQMKLDNSYKTITETNEYFAYDYGRLRDLCISPAGKIYICTCNGNNDDKIFVVDRR